MAPLIYLILLSFHKVTMMNFRSTWPVVGFTNYAALWKDPLVIAAFVRTFEYLLFLAEREAPQRSVALYGRVGEAVNITDGEVDAFPLVNG